MKKIQIAQYIAIVSTVLSIIGYFLSQVSNAGRGLMELGLLVAIIAYIFGGFKNALQMSWSIAKKGWYLVPFPLDILAVMITFVLAIFIFFYLPIIPIRKAYKEET
jgi:hypothetical protein